MVGPIRTAVAVVVLVSLLAVACRSTYTVDGASAQQDSLDAPSEPAEADNPDAPAATVSDGGLGAESPAAAVELLVSAVNAGDPLGVLAMIDQPEREFIDRLYGDLLAGLENEWPNFGGVSALAELGPSFEAGPLSVEELSSHLAWVSTPEVRVTLETPTDTVAGLFATDWYNDGQISEQSASTSDLFGNQVGLVTVERDGRWFVSLARTPFEVVRRDADLPMAAATARPNIAPNYAATPEEAVTNFAAGFRSGDLALFGATLVPGEAEVIADYEDVMRDWLLDGLADMQLTVDIQISQLVSQNDGRAVVEVPKWFIGAEGTFDTDAYRFRAEDTVDGEDTCIFWRGPNNDRQSGCAPVSDKYGLWSSVALTQGWEGPRLIAVEHDEGWLVSIYETAELWLQPHVESPLFTLAYFPWWEADSAVAGIVNSQAKLLPVQGTGTIEASLVAHNMIAIARIQTGPDDGTLTLGQLRYSCEVAIWNTDAISNDWSRGPQYFISESYFDCAEGLAVPANAELTVMLTSPSGSPLVLPSGEPLDSINFELSPR